jgi:hypothetical protein
LEILLNTNEYHNSAKSTTKTTTTTTTTTTTMESIEQTFETPLKRMKLTVRITSKKAKSQKELMEQALDSIKAFERDQAVQFQTERLRQELEANAFTKSLAGFLDGFKIQQAGNKAQVTRQNFEPVISGLMGYFKREQERELEKFSRQQLELPKQAIIKALKRVHARKMDISRAI